MCSEIMPNSAAASRTLVGRVMGILEAFAAGEPELSLVDISRRTGLALSTTHRLTAQLCEWGALDRSPDRRYHLGKRLCDIISAPDAQCHKPYLPVQNPRMSENIRPRLPAVPPMAPLGVPNHNK